MELSLSANVPPEKCKPYAAFGDTRPSYEELKAILHYTEDQNAFTASFLRSEVYLDLAIADPGSHAEWLRNAQASQTHLENAMVSRLAASPGSRRIMRGRFHIVAVNRLRQAEIPNWVRVAQGQPPQNEYELLLSSAERILPLLKLVEDCSGDATRTKLMEFMPILLGARQGYLQEGQGWLGRMGLAREEGRSKRPSPDVNPNWDSGIMFGSQVEDFLLPAIRLSVKTKMRRRGAGHKHENATAYSSAGVLPLSAIRFGFDNPRQIIASCVHELDPLPENSRANAYLLTSPELESITTAIHTQFKIHAKRLATAHAPHRTEL